MSKPASLSDRVTPGPDRPTPPPEAARKRARQATAEAMHPASGHPADTASRTPARDPAGNPSLRTGRSYDLGKMTLRDLWIAYLTYPTILLYFALIALSCALCAHARPTFAAVAPTVAAVIAVYPLAWYGIHRFVLHGQWLYRSRWTASLWKRIHFDHHQDPHLLDVLFGSPLNTIPTIGLITAPLGWLIGGAAGLWAGLAAGFATTCVYEFFHCIQHLAYKPRWAWVARMKQLHVLHHFHDEDGNFGITNYFPDRLFGSFYPSAKARARSASVFNLGYDLKKAMRYPWVMNLTGTPPRDRPRGASSPAATPSWPATAQDRRADIPVTDRP